MTGSVEYVCASCGSPFTWTDANWPLICTNEACDMHDAAKRILVNEPVEPMKN